MPDDRLGRCGLSIVLNWGLLSAVLADAEEEEEEEEEEMASVRC